MPQRLLLKLPLVLLCLVALPLACNGKKLPTIVKAEGTVTLDGTAVENATVSFLSENTLTMPWAIPTPKANLS